MFDDLETYRLWGETLRLVCAFFWITTYVLVIRRGNKDRLPAMPLAALALNICWEGIFSFLYVPDDPRVLAAWGGCFVLDVFILPDLRDTGFFRRVLPPRGKDQLAKRRGGGGVKALSGTKMRLHGLRLPKQNGGRNIEPGSDALERLKVWLTTLGSLEA